jgi:hypothetical protein
VVSANHSFHYDTVNQLNPQLRESL